MNNAVTVLTLSVFIEGITDYLKNLLGTKIKSRIPSVLISIAVGIGVCFLCGADIFSAFGFAEKYAWLGTIFTGILLSRGSNYVHSLFGRIQNTNKN